MSVVISTKNFPRANPIGDIFIKSNNADKLTVKDTGDVLFLRGNLFEPGNGISGVEEKINKFGFDEVKNFDGEFSLIHYISSKKVINIGNDYLGRETFFYYFKNDLFIVSDNFWEIVNIIRPDESMIDKQGVFENIILQRPLEHKTIIENLSFFPAATIAEYQLIKQDLSLKKYWDLQYAPDQGLNINTAIEELDAEFQGYFHKIQKKYHSNTIFLLGLSGGLDSRLAASYAIKTGLNVKFFIIGDKRPNKIFVSRDHWNAYALARFFKENVIDLDYSKTPYSEKMHLEAKHFPMHHARLFHTQTPDSLPDFHVMLNGLMGGETWGSEVRQAYLNLKGSLLAEYIYLYTPMFSGHILYRKKVNIFERIVNRVLKPNYTRYLMKTYLVDRLRIENTQKLFRKFIERETEIGKSSVDIMQKMLFHNISNGKYGSFSMYQDKPNYSFFHPIVKLSMKWPLEYLLNKKLQIAFFINKFSDIAKIPAQDHLEPIYYRNYPGWRRNYYALAYSIRGTGSLSHRTKAYRKDYLDFSHALLENRNSIVASMFDTKKIIQNQVAPHENMLKTAYILECIQNASYRNWTDN